MQWTGDIDYSKSTDKSQNKSAGKIKKHCNAAGIQTHAPANPKTEHKKLWSHSCFLSNTQQMALKHPTTVVENTIPINNRMTLQR